MGFIGPMLAYKFIDKRPWGKSFIFGVVVGAISWAAIWLLSKVISFPYMGYIAMGVVSFLVSSNLRSYGSPEPVKLAVGTMIIEFVVQMVVLFLLVALIGGTALALILSGGLN